MNKTYDYIKTTAALEDFCNKAMAGLLEDDFLTIDTEFIRERTYFPQLCLIQIASADEAAIVDPMADGIDLKPLLDILANPDIIKVIHAGRQDLEIFIALMGELPKNIFDTQIAAMVCGFGDSVGYETLVKKITKNALDKSSRFSNWAQRPLSNKQLDYAIGDVTHLRDIYCFLDKKIKESKREHWIEEEMAVLLSPETYKANPMRLLFKLRLRTSKHSVLARALYLIKWREEKAMKDDKPRQKIMRDDLIVELATQNPKETDDFRNTRSLKGRHLPPKLANDIIDLLKEASSLPKEDCPQLPSPTNEAPVDPLAQDMLRTLLKYIAEKENVAEKILASSKDLTTLIRNGATSDVSCLKGWRYEIFGQVAIDFMNEQIAFSIKNGRVILTRTNEKS